MDDNQLAELRWRLILGITRNPPQLGSGSGSEDEDGGSGGGEQDEDGSGSFDQGQDGGSGSGGDDWKKRERILGFLYDREYAQNRNTMSPKDRTGNLGDTALNVPDWLNSVSELFPQAACERLERDALERYQIDDFLKDANVLARAKPSQNLLRSVLRTKHLMNQEVLAVATDLVRKVIRELMEKLAAEIRQPFSGVRDRNKRSLVHMSQNFDAAYTIKRNLKHYNVERHQIIIERPYFFSRKIHRVNRWKIVIVVDQSGSMVDSVIYSAITASIFHGLPFVTTHLIAFDTNVIDLTAQSIDPVETLMKVQLGGGTDIGQAMNYASQLIDDPEKTIIILISDFFEGAPESYLLRVCHKLLESRVKILGLAALDRHCKPTYNRSLASKLVRLGAEVGAMTPGELASWVAEKVGIK